MLQNAENVSNAPKPRKRALGKQVLPEGTDGLYRQSWYPICTSEDISKGEVKGYPFLGGRVIAFRKESGEAQVFSAYCAHLGADLSAGGCIVNDHLQCPYHYWEYDADGNCVKTGSGDPPPKHARLFSFPTQEKNGVVWAFNGEEPLYDLPDWPADKKNLVIQTEELPFEFPVDPWVVAAQTPDIQHVLLLHNAELIGPDPTDKVRWTDFSMSYDMHAKAQGRIMDITANIFGTSLYFQTGTLDGRWFGFQTAFAMPKPSCTKVFATFAVEKTENEKEDQDFIKLAREHEVAIAMEDVNIANAIHFRVGSLTKKDIVLAKFIDYLRNYPRANPAAEFIE